MNHWKRIIQDLFGEAVSGLRCRSRCSAICSRLDQPRGRWRLFSIGLGRRTRLYSSDQLVGYVAPPQMVSSFKQPSPRFHRCLRLIFPSKLLLGDSPTYSIMSFGFSIGDFISVIDHANKLRKDFAGAPSQFRELIDEYGVWGVPGAAC